MPSIQATSININFVEDVPRLRMPYFLFRFLSLFNFLLSTQICNERQQFREKVCVSGASIGLSSAPLLLSCPVEYSSEEKTPPLGVRQVCNKSKFKNRLF